MPSGIGERSAQLRVRQEGGLPCPRVAGCADSFVLRRRPSARSCRAQLLPHRVQLSCTGGDGQGVRVAPAHRRTSSCPALSAPQAWRWTGRRGRSAQADLGSAHAAYGCAATPPSPPRARTPAARATAAARDRRAAAGLHADQRVSSATERPAVPCRKRTPTAHLPAPSPAALRPCSLRLRPKPLPLQSLGCP
eukprot:scaffold3141_cov350-Prasinococcus_capsulatus_cf.AAC.2